MTGLASIALRVARACTSCPTNVRLQGPPSGEAQGSHATCTKNGGRSEVTSAPALLMASRPCPSLPPVENAEIATCRRGRRAG